MIGHISFLLIAARHRPLGSADTESDSCRFFFLVFSKKTCILLVEKCFLFFTRQRPPFSRFSARHATAEAFSAVSQQDTYPFAVFQQDKGNITDFLPVLWQTDPSKPFSARAQPRKLFPPFPIKTRLFSSRQDSRRRFFLRKIHSEFLFFTWSFINTSVAPSLG